ncbi:PAS domain S-box-containing protein [Clostridium acetobutylicum]|uniref:histidine kinase n=1 Tax=Clostridium acetobutylicum (strain ATCC 824 / DSM 792 / JCM 1419 / IAM 19013 / LMG 5710 / NBRC 13948 / NRRL B-527 / VKM B-1787 / 2291 / W) TaxID=272562 RepID=Q97KL4_CLOAB|nr:MULTISPECIES: PAS domain-containing sensor histidine kinase [Clostridium]AAK78879.1 Sensory transduction histidine kinase [Clostridium acetobutylicum ATCC 824]ADZ19954.1 Sensory transduction histidine kinase [Clostridium acetobutylicum EA 2018]AEI33406.1 sensory transduction histidine kinase [Clostridium acetobutylicum DSM 1731]AWV80598.1 PAS domain-containing sensor histidine kinase [Clostridium acetobutylicum]MBC2392788.1 PAS domain-containing protein [Clostridium acetobutylicum]
MFNRLKSRVRDVNFVVNGFVGAGIIIITCSFVGKVDFVLLYFLIQIMVSMLAISIFANSISNYKYTKDILILTAGIVYFCIGIFYFNSSLNILYQKNYLQYVYKLFMIGIFVDAFSTLFLSLVLNKKGKLKYAVWLYALFAIVVIMITYDYKLLHTYVNKVDIIAIIYATKIISVTILSISMILFICRKKKIGNDIVYTFIVCSIFRIISIIFIDYNSSGNQILLYINIIFRISSIYIVHRKIMIKSVIDPYQDIFFRINTINKELNDKNIELERVNKKLLNENMIKESIGKVLSISSQRYMQILQIMPEAIFIHDNGKCNFINDKAIKLLEVKDVKDIIGKNIVDFIHEDYKELAQARIDKTMKTGMPCDFIEERLVTAMGKKIIIEAATTTFSHNNGTFITIIRDMTEKKKNEANRKKLEQTLYYDKVRKEFFSNLSHELRTPLNILASAMQLVRLNMDNDNKDGFEKYLKIMNQNIYRLTKIIDNLIDITKIDAGYLSVDLHTVEIVSVIEDITMSVIEFVKSKGIDIVFDTDVEEKFMPVDSDKIERVMLNLLSNAVKFTPKGGKITVNVYDKNDSIQIRVKDTGIGIPKDMKETIFQRFIQVNKTLIREKEGSGIGLSIVKSLIEMHGGQIRVESELNVGSEFIIDLPVRNLDDDNAKVIESNKFNKKQKINIEFSDL